MMSFRRMLMLGVAAAAAGAAVGSGSGSGASSGASGGFVPTDIAGLTLWMDATDSASYTTDGSGNVDAYTDKSPAGNDMVQATASGRPSASGSINGNTAFTFDGSNDSLQKASGATLPGGVDQPFSVIIVLQRSSATNNGCFIGWGAAADTDDVSRLWFSGNTNLQYWRRDDARTSNPTPTTTGQGLTTDVHVISYYFSGTDIDITIDGVEVLSGSACDTANQVRAERFAIGALYYGFGVSNYFAGDIGEVLVYDTDLSASNRSSVETYMINKWNPPPAPGTAYQYWRLVITAEDGGGYSGISEMDLRDANDVRIDRDASARVTATASSTQNGSAANCANIRNFNGIEFVNTDGDDLVLDLGVGNSEEFLVAYLKAPTSGTTRMVKDFLIQYSDDNSSWTTVGTFTGETSWSASEGRFFDLSSGGSHRYWRIVVDANDGDATRSAIGTFAMGYSDGSFTSSVAGVVVEPRSINGQFGTAFAYNMHDGSTGTQWTSPGQNNTETLVWTFSKPIDLQKMLCKPENNFPTRAPNTGTIEGSNDGSSWTEVHAFSGSTSWSNLEERDLFLE